MLVFLNSLYLYALIGLAVPIIIHLMKNQVAIRLVFPTIDFLTKGKLPNDGRRKLRDILLLILRLLILLFLILFLAKPEYKEIQNIPKKQNINNREAVMIIDLSASMSGWNSFEVLQQEVMNLANNTEIEKIGLLSFGAIENIRVPLTTDKNKVVQALKNLKPSLLENIFNPNIIKEANKLFSKKAVHSIYIMSDFQLSDWKNINHKINTTADIFLIDTAKNKKANIAILKADNKLQTDKQHFIQVLIKNFGYEKVETSVILKTSDDQSMQKIEIPALSEKSVTIAINKTQSKHGVINIGDDEYQLDNEFYIWFSNKKNKNILIVSDFENINQQEYFFIKKAFEAISMSDNKTYSTDHKDYKKYLSLDLKKYDGIIFLGAGGFINTDFIKKTNYFTADRNIILFTPGAQPQKLFANLNKYKYLNSIFNRVNKFTRNKPSGIKWINPHSNLGELYKNSSDPDIFSFDVFKYIDITTQIPDNILLKFDSEAPAIMHQNKSNSIIYTSMMAFSNEWSELQISTAFIPLLGEIFSNKITKLKKDKHSLTIRELLQQNKKIEIKPQIKILQGIPTEINVSRKESIIKKQSLTAIKQMFKNNKTLKNGNNKIKNTTPLSKYCILLAFLFLILEVMLVLFYDKKACIV